MPLLEKPNFVLIACQPKTASTFVTTAMGQLPGARSISLVPGYDRREQELCEARFRRYRFRRHRHFVSQAHVRFSTPTEALLTKYSVKTVVLIRDLHDSIVSLRDHIRRESPIWPMAYFDQSHLSLNDNQLDLAIARLMVPWYLNFYFSWQSWPDKLLVRYEEVAANTEKALQRIADYVGIAATEDNVREAITSARIGRTRFNNGTAGRGAALSDSVRRAVRDVVDVYPGAADHPYLEHVYRTP